MKSTLSIPWTIILTMHLKHHRLTPRHKAMSSSLLLGANPSRPQVTYRHRLSHLRMRKTSLGWISLSLLLVAGLLVVLHPAWLQHIVQRRMINKGPLMRTSLPRRWQLFLVSLLSTWKTMIAVQISKRLEGEMLGE
jgi:hypothetical protein